MFLVPLAVGAAGAAAILGGTGIGIAASVFSVQTKNLMKHTESKVDNFITLQPGDHISYKISWNQMQHAIIESLDIDDQKAKLIFMTGKNDKAELHEEFVILEEFIKKGQLFRHTYNEILMFSADDVVSRAHCLLKETTETPATIFQSVINDGEDFANWVQLGVTFSEVLRAIVFARDKEYCTKVVNLREIRSGDHVSFKAGTFHYHHAIVINVDYFKQTFMLHYVSDDGKSRFFGQATRNVYEMVTNGELYLHHYDVSVCRKDSRVHDVIMRAGQHFSSSTYSDAVCRFRSCEEFATWCIFEREMSHMDLVHLGRARIFGRLRTKIQRVDDLERGDHIAFKTGLFGNFRHVIILDVDIKTKRVDMVCFSGKDCHLVCQRRDANIVEENIDIGEYLNGNLFRYFYDSSCYSIEETVKRAESFVGQSSYDLIFNNCEHFATWCKTGLEASRNRADFTFQSTTKYN